MSIKICPICGKKLPERARYCSECGYFLKRKYYDDKEKNIKIEEELDSINNIEKEENYKKEKSESKEETYNDNYRKEDLITDDTNFNCNKKNNIKYTNKKLFKKVMIGLAILVGVFLLYNNFLNNSIDILKISSKMGYKKIVRKFENASGDFDNVEGIGLGSDSNEESNTFLDEMFDVDETKVDFYNTNFKVGKEEFNSEHTSLGIGRFSGKTVFIAVSIDNNEELEEALINRMDEKYKPYMDEMIAYLNYSANPYITQYIKSWESNSDYIIVMKEYDKISILIFEKKLYNEENKNFL